MVHGDWTAGAGLAFFVGCVFFVIAVIEIRRKRSFDAYMRNRNPKFVVWYRGPHKFDRVQYLRSYEAGNVAQEYYPAGFEYVDDIDFASRFDSFDEAMTHAPVYDGSDGIESRTGVARVQ